MFSDWYAIYPRKVARMDAEKAWKKLTSVQQQAAIDAISMHVKKWLADGTDRQYIPHPASWLNGHRWEDEIEIEAPKTSNWRQSEEGTMAMAKKVGISPNPGEDFQTLRGRITAKLVRAA